jgi:hypothetical protein
MESEMSALLLAMKRALSSGLLALFAGAAVLCSPNVASALVPLDVEIGAKVGGGTTPSTTPNGAPNPLGFGIGGRAGVSFLGLYGGVSVAYYFGESNTLFPGTSLTTSTHSLLYGFEGGYGVQLVDVLTLRAQVGIGNFTNTIDVSGAGQSYSQSNSNLYLEPGVTVLVALPLSGLFVGVDGNVLVLPSMKETGQSKTATAFTVHGQVGYKF